MVLQLVYLALSSSSGDRQSAAPKSYSSFCIIMSPSLQTRACLDAILCLTCAVCSCSRSSTQLVSGKFLFVYKRRESVTMTNNQVGSCHTHRTARFCQQRGFYLAKKICTPFKNVLHKQSTEKCLWMLCDSADLSMSQRQMSARLPVRSSEQLSYSHGSKERSFSSVGAVVEVQLKSYNYYNRESSSVR